MSLSIQDLLLTTSTTTTTTTSTPSNPQIYSKYGSGDEGVEIDPDWSLKDISQKRQVLLAYCKKMNNGALLSRIQNLFRELDGLEYVRDSMHVDQYLKKREALLQKIHLFLTHQDQQRQKEEKKLNRSLGHLEWSQWRVFLVLKVSWRLLDWYWKNEGIVALRRDLTKNLPKDVKESASSHYGAITEYDIANFEKEDSVFRIGYVNSWRVHFMTFWARILTHLPSQQEGFDMKPHIAIVVVWLFLNCVGHISGVTLEALSQRFTYMVQQNYIQVFEEEYVSSVRKEGKQPEDFVSYLEIEADTKEADMTKMRRNWLQEICGCVKDENVDEQNTVSAPFSTEQMFLDACRIRDNLEELRNYNAYHSVQFLMEQLEARAPDGNFLNLPLEGERIKRRVSAVLKSFKSKSTSICNMHATRSFAHNNALRMHPPEVEIYARLIALCKTRIQSLIELLDKNGINLYKVMQETIGVPRSVEELQCAMEAFGGANVSAILKTTTGDRKERNKTIAVTQNVLPPQPLHKLTMPFFDQYPVFKKWSMDDDDEDVLSSYQCDTCSHTSESVFNYLTHMYEAHGENPHKFHSVSLRALGNRLDTLPQHLDSSLDVLPHDIPIVTEAISPEAYARGSTSETHSRMKDLRRTHTNLQMSLMLGVPFLKMKAFRDTSGSNTKKSVDTRRKFVQKTTHDQDFLSILFNLKNHMSFSKLAKHLDMHISQLKSRYYRLKREGLDKAEYVVKHKDVPKEKLIEWYERSFKQGIKVEDLIKLTEAQLARGGYKKEGHTKTKEELILPKKKVTKEDMTTKTSIIVENKTNEGKTARKSASSRATKTKDAKVEKKAAEQKATKGASTERAAKNKKKTERRLSTPKKSPADSTKRRGEKRSATQRKSDKQAKKNPEPKTATKQQTKKKTEPNKATKQRKPESKTATKKASASSVQKRGAGERNSNKRKRSVNNSNNSKQKVKKK
eukprot:CAMPEP_0117436208 /NCGR_PEP_ID=MMETSP0759-20121206/888_1 /TAXON_ID=63605 /ORGANISM="Percolomonas cosmopolitus, Strain WS" /LENGTH=961 /DNA_ID=CAMNT_0005227799 /DNA_START=42 /DNA_END=2924 /DNA_ORIENTATION=+